jgi:hypothetical protein
MHEGPSRAGGPPALTREADRRCRRRRAHRRRSLGGHRDDRFRLRASGSSPSLRRRSSHAMSSSLPGSSCPDSGSQIAGGRPCDRGCIWVIGHAGADCGAAPTERLPAGLDALIERGASKGSATASKHAMRTFGESQVALGAQRPPPLLFERAARVRAVRGSSSVRATGSTHADAVESEQGRGLPPPLGTAAQALLPARSATRATSRRCRA